MWSRVAPPRPTSHQLGYNSPSGMKVESHRTATYTIRNCLPVPLHVSPSQTCAPRDTQCTPPSYPPHPSPPQNRSTVIYAESRPVASVSLFDWKDSGIDFGRWCARVVVTPASSRLGRYLAALFTHLSCKHILSKRRMSLLEPFCDKMSTPRISQHCPFQPFSYRIFHLNMCIGALHDVVYDKECAV